MTPHRRFAPLLLLPITLAPAGAGPAKPNARHMNKASAAKSWWPTSTNAALARAGANRAELVRALESAPRPQREAMAFLVANMPERDLKSLSSKYLLENVALAFQARQSSPWKAHVSEALFLNDVLPYAFLDEERDASRARLRALSLPLIAGAKTPGEAAQRLNQKLFPLVKVKYSTQRKKPNQNASESIESGLASCSGLSVLLAGACRSVGIPARIVGTPMWANGRGNHTWVEIWDGGWHFTGACEPDEKGLDRGWFVGDAAQAKADVPANAIYATTWKKSGTAFPMVWNQQDETVAALNVTARYAKAEPAVAEGKSRLLVQVLGADGKRMELPVTVLDADDKELGSGTTKGEGADTNDFFSVEAPKKSKVTVVLTMASGSKLRLPGQVGEGAESKFALQIKAAPAPVTGATTTSAPFNVTKYLAPKVTPLSAASQAAVEKAASEYFALPMEQRAGYKFPAALDALLLANDSGVRAAAWAAFKKADHAAAKADFEASRVRFGTYESPYVVREVGTRPANGWPLFIAMHGGGGAPKEVNDSQYQGMQRHYKDHPELGGYKYLALRAPNDTWNGFYDDYVYPLIGNLTANFNLFGDIDPNKVYAMGYSHGGYGAYAIGPKMPDHFAAVHASAAAATDGESVPETLRTTVFTAMVGEHDLAYDRLSRNQKFDEKVKALRGDRTDIYPVRVDVALGFQHGNLNDRDKIVEMYQYSRNPIPAEIAWLQTDTVIRDFFWLTSSNPAKEKRIDARRQGNAFTVTTQGGAAGSVLMDTRTVDFAKPISLTINGRKTERKAAPSLKTLCETMARRGDPESAFSAELPIS